MKRSFRFSVLVLLFFILILPDAHAQGWFQRYSQPHYQAGADVLETPDGGFLAVGSQWDTQNPGVHPTTYLHKTDSLGNTLWTREPSTLGISQNATVAAAVGTDVVVAGRVTFSAPISNDSYLCKVDSAGNLLWETSYDMGQNSEYINDMKPTSDGGFILAGEMQQATNPAKSDGILLKLDSTGNFQWSHVIGDSLNDRGFGVIETADGSILYTGHQSDTATGDTHPQIVKYDSAGGMIWNYISPVSGIASDIVELPSGNYVVTLVIGYSSSILWLDANGNPLSTQLISQSQVTDIELDTNQDLVLFAMARHFANPMDYYSFDVIKTDTLGSLVCQNEVAYSNFAAVTMTRYAQGTATSDGGYLLISSILDSLTSVRPDLFLVKTDANCVSIDNLITGTIYTDSSGNCQRDPGELPNPNWIVRATPGPRYDITDLSGDYALTTTVDTYTVETFAPNYLWEISCPSPAPFTHTVGFNLTADTARGIDFASPTPIQCPLMTVDFGCSFLRPCFQSNYTIQWCNEGTVAANNASVVLHLDTLLTILNSFGGTPSPDSTTWTWNLGTVQPGQCGFIPLSIYTPCNTEVGRTACNTIEIFPDTICLPPDSNWDESSVTLSASCLSDSLVCFTIANTGIGNMQGTTAYRVFENSALLTQGQLQLCATCDTTLCWPTNGNTLRMEVDQRPGHPGQSRPVAEIESCGTDGQGGTVLGHLGGQYQDEGDFFRDVDCRTVVNSFDPNDKQVQPRGITPQHYVAEDQELSYQINFQNTGTAPAITVVIRDTLPMSLDMLTLDLGVTSHPLSSFSIEGANVLVWTFNNINLPDSVSDEPGSHGFVQFKMKPVTGIAPGTRIENNAGIYFDNNDPVITDYTLTTILDTLLLSSRSVPGTFQSGVQVKVFPNPFQRKATVSVAGYPGRSQALVLTLYDLTGNEVYRFSGSSSFELPLEAGTLSGGMYFYTITAPEGKIATGKVILTPQ